MQLAWVQISAASAANTFQMIQVVTIGPNFRCDEKSYNCYCRNHIFLCSHSLLLHNARPQMAWLGYIFFNILEILDHPTYHPWYHFLPTTLDGRGRKIICTIQLNPTMPRAGIKLGPPAQQARALSISPLPPGSILCVQGNPTTRKLTSRYIQCSKAVQARQGPGFESHHWKLFLACAAAEPLQ